jgi:hypothetical protein
MARSALWRGHSEPSRCCCVSQLDLCATDPQHAELMTSRQRLYAPTYAKTLADRKKRTATERKKILDEQARKDKEKAAVAKAELQRLRQLAETWRTDIQLLGPAFTRCRRNR